MRIKRLTFLTTLVAAWIGSTVHAHARPLDEVKSSGVLKIGLEPGFLPFEMKLPSGAWEGFDVEMMTAFAKELGVSVEFIDTKWDGIIPALMAQKFDVIVSGMTITEERKQAVAFSTPYYDAGLQALYSANTTATYATLADLDKTGLKIAVKQGTTGDIYSKKTFKNATLVQLESEADAANSVRLGKVDAFIYDKPFLSLFASLNSDKVRLMDGLLSTEQFGVAARKKDQDLLDAFNTFLQKWKESGSYDKAIEKHFVAMPWKAQLGKIW
jgi:polar amino acid transport system substrate-binding protein